MTGNCEATGRRHLIQPHSEEPDILIKWITNIYILTKEVSSPINSKCILFVSFSFLLLLSVAFVRPDRRGFKGQQVPKDCEESQVQALLWSRVPNPIISTLLQV